MFYSIIKKCPISQIYGVINQQRRCYYICCIQHWKCFTVLLKLVLESDRLINWYNENHFNISFPIWYIFFISVWYLWHWLWPININAHRFLHWLAMWYSSSCISISTYRGMFFVWPRQKHDSYPRKINGPTINDRLSIMRQFEYLIWSTWTHTHQNVATKTS